MQATRNVQYASITNSSMSGNIYSSASTFGELKGEDAQIGALASSGMKALIKDGNGNEYQVTGDSTQLPEGDFKMYFVNNKNDSGRN